MNNLNSDVPASNVNALVLAAGRSSRMGHHKILLPTKDGHSVLGLLLSKLLNCISGKIAIIVGRDAYTVQKTILNSNLDDTERLEFIFNPKYSAGMSTSLTVGTQHFSKTKKGLGIFLADQPLISQKNISHLLDAYKTKAKDCIAVAAALGQKRLNPVIFSPEFLGLLEFERKQVSGDVGARVVLKKYVDRVQLVDLGDGLWSQDIDDWEGYSRVARAANWPDAINFIDKHTQG